MWNRVYTYTATGAETAIVPTFDTEHTDLLIVAKSPVAQEILMNLSDDGGATFPGSQVQMPNAKNWTLEIDDYTDVYPEPVMLGAPVVASSFAPASGNITGSAASPGEVAYVPFAASPLNAVRLLCSGSGKFAAGTVIEVWLR